jgi:hypothetical protein
MTLDRIVVTAIGAASILGAIFFFFGPSRRGA